MPKIELYFNDKLIEGWTQLNITQSIDQLCVTWSASFPTGVLTLNDIMNTNIVAILIDDNLEFLGYIEKYNHRGNSQTSTIELAGRNTICDLVDCSITDTLKSQLGALNSTETGAYAYLKKVTALILDDIYPPIVQYATGFTDTGVDVVKVGQPQVIDLVEAPVETVLQEELNIETATKGYNIINNIANKLGVAVTSDGAGNLIFFRPLPINKNYTPSNVKNVTVSEDSDNELDGAVSYDITNCFNTYKLSGEDTLLFETIAEDTPIIVWPLDRKGPTTIGWSSKTIKQPITQIDSRFRSNRFTEIKCDSSLSKDNLRTYLNNEVCRRVSESFKYQLTVPNLDYNCRDYVNIDDKLLNFKGLFLIQTRNITITEEEIKTAMVCVSSNTYTAEDPTEVLNSTEVEIGSSADDLLNIGSLTTDDPIVVWSLDTKTPQVIGYRTPSNKTTDTLSEIAEGIKQRELIKEKKKAVDEKKTKITDIIKVLNPNLLYNEVGKAIFGGD